MNWKPRLLRNFPSGVFVGAVLGILLCWMVVGQPVLTALVQFPTLLTGLIAIAAAAIALTGTLSAIENQSALAEASRNGKLASARAVLPLALSEICGVCQNRAAYAVDRRTDRKASDWTFSEATQKTLRDVIESAPVPHQQILSDIIAIYQVLIARSRDGHFERGDQRIGDPRTGSLDRRERFNEAANWMTIYCLACLLFPFGRGANNVISREGIFRDVAAKLRFVEADGRYLQASPGFDNWLNDKIKRGRFHFSDSTWAS